MRKKNRIKILLGSNIKYYRAKAGFTQVEFSEMIGCDVKYLGDVENGWNYPSSELLLKIVQIIDIPVALLFTVRD